MKKTTIDRIITSVSPVIIGRYTYKADLNTGDILRCKTDDIGREWIARDGDRSDGWEKVSRISA